MKLTATEPYKAKAKRMVMKVLKPARYRDVETGKFEIKEIIDGHGKIEKKQIPIVERVFVEALKEEQEIEIDVWIVETTFDKKTEYHEFANEEDAQRYYGGF